MKQCKKIIKRVGFLKIKIICKDPFLFLALESLYYKIILRYAYNNFAILLLFVQSVFAKDIIFLIYNYPIISGCNTINCLILLTNYSNCYDKKI